jgi:GntR family transcriptional regulator
VTAVQHRILKHQMVRAHLDRLLDGMAEGEAFPSERDLAERFDVARETVRQALRELLLAGRIERRGRSTVVSRPKLVQPLAMGSYTEAARARGLSAERLLLGWTELEADDALAAHLAVATGTQVWQLERVLIVDGFRIGLETTYLPAQRYPGLVDGFDSRTSLYAEITARGIAFTRTADTIETTLPDAREAALLAVDARTPMFLIHRVSYDQDDTPIERCRSLYRGDRMTFTTTMRAEAAVSPNGQAASQP